MKKFKNVLVELLFVLYIIVDAITIFIFYLFFRNLFK